MNARVNHAWSHVQSRPLGVCLCLLVHERYISHGPTLEMNSCGGTQSQIEPCSLSQGATTKERTFVKKKKGGKIITIATSFLFSWTAAGCVFHGLLFSSSSPSFFCPSLLFSPLWKYTGNFFPHRDFSHNFCSLGIWMLSGDVLLTELDWSLLCISKHFTIQSPDRHFPQADW